MSHQSRRGDGLPRKNVTGVTNTARRKAQEYLGVIVALLVALGGFTKNPKFLSEDKQHEVVFAVSLLYLVGQVVKLPRLRATTENKRRFTALCEM